MCGIVGFSGKQEKTSLVSGLSMIKHRGPDDFGLVVDDEGFWGLGHTRLSIIDLSASGHQPMASKDGGVILIFNGEIYNYRELRDKLKNCGYEFNGDSDTEVLLNLYLYHRNSVDGLDAMLRSLNGIFAFALWDNCRQEILVVRDAIGVKPVYYVSTDRGFAFCSEIKGLTPFISTEDGNLSQKNSTLDAVAINRYLSFLWCPGAGTPLKAVRKLGPGEAIWVKQGKISQHWVWYKLPVFRGLSIISSRQSAITGTAGHLRLAVQRQMVADVPVGAFLSGGLDSSSIVAFAAEINPNIRCFTIESFGTDEDGFSNDLPYAHKVAGYLKVPLEVVSVNADRTMDHLDYMVEQLGEPLADPATLNVLYISRLARDHGIKVLLSGAGGDDLFTGYRRHRALTAESSLSWLPHSVRLSLEILTRGLNQRHPLFRRLRRFFNGAALDNDSRLVNYFRWVDQRDLMALYSSDFRNELIGEQAEQTMLDYLVGLPAATTRLERMLALEQRFFLTDHNLAYTDRMSMAAGVEVRVPFLDLDLVDFAARIPAGLKQRGSEGKWVLKKAMEPYLPRDVIYRPKSGFGAPLRRWIRVELKDIISEVLGAPSLRRRGIFDPEAVQKLIKANDIGAVDASYTIFSLVCVEIWCRKYIDRNSADSHKNSINKLLQSKLESA